MENNDQNKNSEHTASSKVLEKIRLNQVAMKPRLHFTLKTIALAVVAFMTLIFSVAIGAFILFSIRTSYVASLLGYGPHGILIFIQLFPWGLLIADIGLIILLELMLRYFRFGYKSPLLYLLFGIVVFALSVVIVIDQSHASDMFLRGAHESGLPFMGNLYDHGRRPPPPGSGACPCIVEAINGAQLTMLERIPDGTTREVMVILPNDQASSTIKVGDHLFIVGHFDDRTLHAFNVYYMDGDSDLDDGFPPAPNQQ